MSKSLYIHIPFCRRKCIYCDFYSINYKKDIASRYIDVLSKEITALDSSFSTIYIGGGTPTIIDLELLKRLLISLRKVSKNVKEFTVEANPESIDKGKIKLLLREGVNRISIGVQSCFAGKLKKLTRLHSYPEARDKILMAKEEGFKNIGIDLIFGVWGQDLQSWKEELKIAVNLPIEHISTYSLTYEKKTPLFRKIRSEKIRPLEDEVVGKMYEFAMDYLPKAGFFQYEVSNFSRPGYACQHNLNYWENNSYQGLGPSAASYHQGIRMKNICDIKEYIKRREIGMSTFKERENLPPFKKAKEFAKDKYRFGVSEVKFLPKEIKFATDLLVFGDKVATISFENVSAAIIEDKNVAEMQKAIMKFIWHHLSE